MIHGLCKFVTILSTPTPIQLYQNRGLILAFASQRHAAIIKKRTFNQEKAKKK